MRINEFFFGRHVVCDANGVEKTVWYSREQARSSLYRNGKNGWYVKNSRDQIVFKL